MPSGVYIRTPENRRNIGLTKIGHKKSDRWYEVMKGRTPWNKGLKLPQYSGENSPNWKGGNSRYYKEGYYTPEYLKWRNEVFTRDNFTCQKCGEKGYITAHHIKSWAYYPELRFDINNGITLCEDCHSLTDNYKGRAKGKQ